MSDSAQAYLLIVALGLATYATRIGGDLILSRFGKLNPRVEAALDSIPIAVMTALLAPIALASGVANVVGVIVAGLISLKFPMHYALIGSVPVVAALRAFGF